ncbi:diguanylate cyclase (GGDEF) domain-containing protein [Marinitoga hydrogenitolerans DSM 16785]|uniref:Diguanylate cyclase (GGDEF) domain-containing protein n=1 Tax=Marinitoga hydrogenitolerans (strain DSM 16785 / JCM 12826 / AT1271) TaxID=1122195 RepID=A0A1M4UBQ9_MARH1|nr:GGDEF domain-containing protein [Marinitoga hydrogenitolerans]SHE54076.1 diguanylate cyclase (GGDEF) domain-containing protein [Marinitoga hydrogenitolerans DSM 16785]
MIAIEKGLIKEKDLKKLKFEYTIFDNDAEINSANIIVSKKKIDNVYTILVTKKLDEKILEVDDFILAPVNPEELNYRVKIGLEKVKRIKELERLSLIDYLTGVYNRRAITDLLKKEIERSKRENKKFVVSMLDFDNFKNVNDKYGHDAGDEVLRDTINLIRKKVRFYDLIGRLGGEEFLIILSNITKENALKVSERIRKAIEDNTVCINGYKIKITVSQGLALFDGNKNIDQLIKEADLALYEAKEKGKNKVVFFNNN